LAPVRPAPETIGFLLIPQFSMIAFAAAVEPLRLANHVSGRELYRWMLISRDGGSETASNGIAVPVDHPLADAPLLPTVIVCSGIDGHWYQDRKVLAWLRRAAARGATLGSLCTGGHILARAGLLDGYRCTVHWENMAGFTESFPNVEATGELFTLDRNRFTCAGGAAATDLMLHRIAAAHGEQLAAQVGEQMLHEKIRPGAMRQHAVAQTPGAERRELHAAVQLMMENIETPVDLPALASRIGQSRRNLERLFRKYMDCSPARFYLGLRLSRGRQLLDQTAMPMLEVALACGFLSAAHFSKRYRSYFGQAPRVARVDHRLRGFASLPGARSNSRDQQTAARSDKVETGLSVKSRDQQTAARSEKHVPAEAGMESGLSVKSRDREKNLERASTSGGLPQKRPRSKAREAHS
jgi:transcriptional regulator GlxA family with amidase domain